MWQEKQIELLKSEIEVILASLPDNIDFTEIIKEPLIAPKRGLSVESAHDNPWPLLPVIVCEALSGQWEQAVPMAAVFQILMAAGDVLDDVEDADSSQSLSSKYGLAVATNAATTLIILAERAITQLQTKGVTDDLIVRIMNAVNTYSISVCVGQHLDLSLSLESGISEDSYLKIIGLKSASQMECACHIGALLATEKQELVDTFKTFGYNLGMAAQITNDISGTLHGSDIEKKKMSLPLIYALTQKNDKPLNQLVKTFIEVSESEINPIDIRKMLFRCGAIYYAIVKMQFYKQLAINGLLKAKNLGANVERLELLLEKIK